MQPADARTLRSNLGTLWLFGLTNYAVLFVLLLGYVDASRFSGPAQALFAISVVLCEPVLLLLIALAPAALVLFAARSRPRLTALGWVSAVAGASLLVLAIYTDRRSYEIFGFHLNGFVWNLITTPGGIASMGAGAESFASAAGIAVAVVIGESLLLLSLLGTALGHWLQPLHARRSIVVFGTVMTLVLLSECLAYGSSDLNGYRPVLRQAQAFPLFVPVRFKRVAASFGYRPVRTEGISVDEDHTGLLYPLEPIRGARPTQLYNVLWLCSESLRADMLDPEIMPATWALAQRSGWFRGHVSGSNGTRMGIFSMFYGLPGSYWFSFLGERRGPVLIDRLLDLDYQITAHTSDDFSYPEFALTVWSRVDPARLHEYGPGGGTTWERDRHSTAELMDWIAARDPKRPFFAFSFFESPHAKYSFPPESVIRTSYLENFNYVSTDLKKQIELIKNRYVNSVHHLDSQFARLFAFLEEQHLMDSTIIVVTGDHGEEFMDAGRWGHNSAFSEAQIRVPLVIHVPGRAPEATDRLTSHLDLPATLMKLLGVENAPESYGIGLDLFGGETRRHAYLSDWYTVTYLDPELKLSFPINYVRGLGERVSTRRDVEIDDPSAQLAARHEDLVRMLADLARFHRRRG